MSDTIYRDSDIPTEYNIVAYNGNDFYFFKDGNYNECYTQKYIQGRYVVDFVYPTEEYNLLSTSYTLSSDWCYRQDVSHIFVIFFGIFFLLIFGVNIITRSIHRKGLL